jgi:hypothetical protein
MTTKNQKTIGLDREKFDGVIGSYRLLVDNLNQLWSETRKIFPEFELSELNAFIASKQDPEYYLQKHYISKHPEKFSGFDVDKVIKANLIDLPDLTQASVAHRRVRDQIDSHHNSIRKTGLFFPILKLYDHENKIFTFTDEFNEVALQHCIVCLQTSEQEQIYEALQAFIPGLNLFKNLGLMEKTKFSDNFAAISDAVQFDKGQFKLKSTMFRTPFLHRFNEEKENRGSFKDIFKT